MLICGSPIVLGMMILVMLPESPVWLSRNHRSAAIVAGARKPLEVFRPPLLKYTILGVLLATVPIMGNWGATNWLVPWADQAQDATGDHTLHASTQCTKSSGAALGGLLGGWLASVMGRRTSYFTISLISLVSSFYIFHSLTPTDPTFLAWVFVQGFFGPVYFGWMPLYFPELFPARMRATGTGVAFNWGRVATGAGVLMGGQLIISFRGDYARVGKWTCLIYAMGMVIILFAPDTSTRRMEDRRYLGIAVGIEFTDNESMLTKG